MSNPVRFKLPDGQTVVIQQETCLGQHCFVFAWEQRNGPTVYQAEIDGFTTAPADQRETVLAAIRRHIEALASQCRDHAH